MGTGEGTPDGGPGIGEILQRISGQLDHIGGKLETIEQEEIPELEKQWKRNLRRAIVYIVLAAALGISIAVWLSQRSDQSQNTQTARFALANCQAGNQVRAEDLAAERKLIALTVATAAHPDSPGTRAKAAQALAAFEVKDRPRDCAHLAAGSPGVP